MARAVGLDLGEHEVKLVELEGSVRKPRLARVGIAPAPEDAGSAAPAVRSGAHADVVAGVLADTGIPKDGVLMAFPCREAVLRSLAVPFVGREQIRKVIKFEAEGSIHSHSVDDMVVDFHPIAEAATETRVLVAAVPKAALRPSLQALERKGIEPEVVDLDAMALFRTAEWCGAFTDDEEEALQSAESEATPAVATALTPVGSEETAPMLTATTSSPARLVLDLGARSTRILVVVDQRLVDMRTLRTGADGMAEEIAAARGIDVPQAREAIEESLRSEEDFLFVVEGEDAEPPAAGEEPEEGHGEQVVPYDLVVAARDRYLQRLRRELMRFVTAVHADGIERVWVTGGASEISGVDGVLEDVFGVAPRKLDVLARLAHRLDPDEAADLGPKLAVAVGMALRGLGGKAGFNFRQEDLAFTKGFDRIKFPLAIASMLALFLVLVFALKSWNELKAKKNLYGGVHEVTEVERRGRVTDVDPTFYGYVGLLMNEAIGWFALPGNFDQERYEKLQEKVLEADVFERLPLLRREIGLYFRNLQQESGYYSDLRIGSGLGALVSMAEVLQSIEPQLGRYLVTEIEIQNRPGDRGRKLSFKIALRSDERLDFRKKWDLLERAFLAACQDPDSPFAAINERMTGSEEPFQGGEAGDGAFYQVELELAPEDAYPVFPPESEEP